jgi:hypothetical protein
MKPFMPSLKANEKVIDISVDTSPDAFTFTYIILKEGGVNNSQLCEGN